MADVHRLAIRTRYQTGVEEWTCAECGFAFITTGRGGFSIILCMGDTGVRHQGPDFHLDYTQRDAEPDESEDDFWNGALDELIE